MSRWRPRPDPTSPFTRIESQLTRIETHMYDNNRAIHRELEKIMSSQESIDQDVAQLTKALAEIRGLVDQQVAAIAALQAQVDAGSAVDLTALSAVTQQLDDVVPDAPAEPTA